MFHHSCPVSIPNVGESMRPASVPYQKAVALGEIPGIVRPGKHLHQTAVAVLAVPCRNTFADYPAARVFPYMYHLRPCIRLLEIVGYSHRIELG